MEQEEACQEQSRIAFGRHHLVVAGAARLGKVSWFVPGSHQSNGAI